MIIIIYINQYIYIYVMNNNHSSNNIPIIVQNSN